MLGRFSTVLQNAVDALAPPAPLHEDFAYHWKKLMRHYLDVSTTKQVPIELTNIPAHFDQLLKILVQEDDERGGKGGGRCLEYLLEHSLLDLVATLAGSDDPPGMRQHVLQFVARLLTQVKAPVAAHTSVFPPLQRLVGLCDGSTPTPTESDEVHFLLGLAALIRRTPQLVPLFTSSQSERARRGSWSSDASSQVSVLTCGSDSTLPVNNPLFPPTHGQCTPPAVVCGTRGVRLVPPAAPPTPPPSNASDETLPLLDALLSYLDTADSRVRVKACQGLMLVLSIPDDRLATAVAEESTLSTRLSTKLASLCQVIPATTEPNHIDDMVVSWGLDVPTSPCVSCEGCRQVASFLSWFDFCDQVLSEAHNVIREAIRKAITERFLEEVYIPESFQILLNITILTKCFKMASSPILNNTLCNWVIAEKGEGSRTVCAILLDFWFNSSELALESLRFFEVLLEKGNENVLNYLVFAYLNRPEDGNSTAEHNKTDQQNNVNGMKASPAVEKIIQSLLSVVPAEARSSGSGGYEQYVSESHRQYSALLAVRQNSKRTMAELLHKEGESPFLSTVFKAVTNIPNQDYEVNLQLTAVVSRLALTPNLTLEEILLIGEGGLLFALREVGSYLAKTVTPRPDYRQVLASTRARLLGQYNSSDTNLDEWSSAFESIVVVEELCKELAAIAYVKHKHHS